MKSDHQRRGIATGGSLFFVMVLVAVLAAIPSLALADATSPSGSFYDDDGNVHEGNIEAIAAEQITKGCNPPQNTSFCPGSSVTRGQMAAFLVRALDLPATGTDYFTDDNESIFEADINRLAESGITKGCNPPANDDFCPDSKVTREQMAAFLVRALKLTDDGESNPFTDDDDSIFEEDIEKLATAGITKGCNPPANSMFCPKDKVLRDQMGSFLGRALSLTPRPPSLDHSGQEGVQLNFITTAQDAGCPDAFKGGESNGITETCNIESALADGTPFWVRHGYGVSDWSLLTSTEKDDAIDGLETVTFRLSINGTAVKSSFEEWAVDEAEDVMRHSFNSQFPGSLNGTHRLVGEWIDRGFVEFRVTLDLNVDG
jgi:hypothetical protein